MTTELKAGLFVLAAISALVYMTTRLTQNRFSFKGTKRYYAQVADATGLINKTKVKMAGLDVGQVVDIILVGRRAKVTMEIAADIEMHKDGYVVVKSIGFLGDRYIELFPGTDGSPALEEGGLLAESFSGGGLDQLTAKTTEVLENIKEITQILKDSLKGAASEGDDTRLDRILDNMEEFTSGLANLDKLGDMTDRLTEVAANLQDITGKVRRGEGTVGKLLYDEETVDKLNSTLSGVNKFVTKADKMAVWIDARSGFLTATGGAKTSASLILQPTYDKYYLFGVTASPRGTTSEVTTTTTTDSVTTTTRKKETEETGIGINVQFAKRFADFWARVGLFETTGGIALDYGDLGSKLRASAELYRFTKGANPQLNVATELHVYKPFFLWTGGEEMLNQTTRNFFVGAGLRFSDNDIKSLITAAAAGAN